MLQNAALTRLEETLDHIREAPADGGTVELIARRPAVDEREVLTEARLDVRDGLEGDTWCVRGSSRSPDGGLNREAQPREALRHQLRSRWYDHGRSITGLVYTSVRSRAGTAGTGRSRGSARSR